MPVYVSDRLTATLGVVRGSPTPTRLIQWFRGSTTIAGANASTYTVTSDDIGQPISVRQTETNYFGSAVATSAATEDVEVFDPSILFSASEPGVWYDPTDAANLAWRRNLLLWSQDWSNIVWTKSDVLTPTNAETAPDSTLTAWKIVPTAASSSVHRVAQFVAGTTAATHTISVYAKAAGYPKIGIREGNSTGAYATFDLSLGTLLEQSGAVGTITSVGSGWYRCAITFSSGVGIRADIGPLPASYTSGIPVFPFTGDGTSGTLLWGAQMELGSTATTYQPITDLNTEVIAQFPNATLYQNVAGTIPVYAPEQPVGLMLDKSRGLVLGPEVILNGNFSAGLTSWNNGAATIGTLVGNAVFIQRNDALSINSGISQSTAIAGKTYLVEFDVLSGAGLLFLNDLVNVTATAGRKRFIFTSVGSGSFSARCYDGGSATIDNISVKELPGNHARQSTDVSRPLYGIVPVSGRRNQLTWSEQFDNAAWTKSNVSAAANTTTAPNGEQTADSITADGASNFHFAFSPNPFTWVAATYVMSSYFKIGTNRYAWLGAYDNTTNFGAVFDLQLGTYVGPRTGGGTVVASIDPVGSGWYRCSMRFTAAAGTATQYGYSVGTTNNGALSLVDTSTGSIFVWGAQLELGSTATAYQKVTTDYDVTEAGVASVGYLRFDGTNDFMVTGTITPGTNKAQAFVGVRKLSDAAVGLVFETGTGSETGTILATAPRSAGVGNYRFISYGTVLADVFPASGYSAPITNVLTGIGDISGDNAVLRLNGTQVAQNTNDQGTGNYSAQPLYIGRRAGTSLEFNGQMFPLIVRFGPNMSSALIRTTENWVASKTAGVVLP
jgi:hypothetical protein